MALIALPIMAATVLSGCRYLNDLQLDAHGLVTSASGGLAEVAEVSAVLRQQLRDNEQRMQELTDEVLILTDEASSLANQGREVAAGLQEVAKQLGDVVQEVSPVAKLVAGKGEELLRESQLTMDETRAAIIDLQHRAKEFRDMGARADTRLASFLGVVEGLPPRTLEDYRREVSAEARMIFADGFDRVDGIAGTLTLLRGDSAAILVQIAAANGTLTAANGTLTAASATLTAATAWLKILVQTLIAAFVALGVFIVGLVIYFWRKAPGQPAVGP